MKRYLFASIFSLILTLAPLSSLAHALNSSDLRLENYHGGSIDLSESRPRKRQLILAGDNVIDTTDEYGLKVATSRFNIINDDAAGASSTLTINVNSATTTANGLLNTAGNFSFGDNVSLTINVRSTLPATETSTDNVTGITTPLDKAVNASVKTSITIDNPTGNFGIYTGYFGAAQYEAGSSNLGYRPFLTIAHKITDGYGDAFFYNDFEGTDIPDAPRITVARPDYTFTHEKSATLGTFRFIPAINGVSANFDTELTAGEDFATANARIVSSLAKELHPENYTNLVCILAPDYCPFNPELYEIDTAHSEIVLADNLTTGAYHANTDTTITTDAPYALKIAFKPSRSDYAFARLDGFGPFSRALLNGFDVYDYIDERHAERAYLSPYSIYILAPLIVTTPESEESEPIRTLVIEEEPEEEPKENQAEVKITIPKAPNTGRQ